MRSSPRNAFLRELQGSLSVGSHNNGLGFHGMSERTVRFHNHDRIFSLLPSVHIAESSQGSRKHAMSVPVSPTDARGLWLHRIEWSEERLLWN